MAPSKGSSKKSASKPPEKSRKGSRDGPAGKATNTHRQPVIAPSTLQSILDIFISAFPEFLEPNKVNERLLPTVQEVKGHLFHRDFAAAFGSPRFLEAYVARWSPSRALAYCSILDELAIGSENLGGRCLDAEGAGPPFNAVCLGGGAGAEVVALAASRSLFPAAAVQDASLHVTCIDSADWQDTLVSLVASCQKQFPQLPAQGPEQRENSFSCSFVKVDLLSNSVDDHLILKDLFQGASLVTIMFTLNELYNTSIPSTQGLLLRLSAEAAPGTILLIVDSPGSYSTVSVGGKERKYPMSWLLDHTLLKVAADVETTISRKSTAEASTESSSEPSKVMVTDMSIEKPAYPWEKLSAVDSQWFRLDPSWGLRYPISLENMRYQMHVFRRR